MIDFAVNFACSENQSPFAGKRFIAECRSNQRERMPLWETFLIAGSALYYSVKEDVVVRAH